MAEKTQEQQASGSTRYVARQSGSNPDFWHIEDRLQGSMRTSSEPIRGAGGMSAEQRARELTERCNQHDDGHLKFYSG